MNLPEGTVTFLFSDVEGSTQLLEQHPHEMGAALARHHELFEAAVAEAGGVIFETVGDAVYAAFSSPSAAVAAALRAQLSLAAEDWGVVQRIACRISLHGGEVERRGDHYFGPALFRCARLQAIGYGEQTLLSAVTAESVRDHLPDGASLRDLGQHRLKDLGQPEHVYMLLHPKLRSTFPPPKSVDLRPNNLPLQLSSFVGRTAETDEVAKLANEHRLVTLTGPGGVGKTRLALQVAGQLITDLPDGAFLVDLAAARTADQVGPVAAAALGLSVVPGRDPLEATSELVAARRMLMVVDNVEQIPDVSQPLLQLLAAAPGVRLLVTSRTPLHVRGERVHEVHPLPTDGGSSPAVDLFVARATAAGDFEPDGDDATIAEICRRLDGIPLAIELAAARTTIFSPADLLARLDHRLKVLTTGARDLPERQRTLRAAIEWSYDLLERDERAAFASLGVFHGGWALDAAEAVAGAGPDLHERLHDVGLVQREGTRFRLLETIREFAQERLDQLPGASEVGRRHAEWYVEWIEGMADPHPNKHLIGPEQMRAAGTERENLSAAMDHLLGAGDGQRARRLALRLWLFWLGSGYMARGEGWINAALEAPPPPGQSEAVWLTAVSGEFPRFAGDMQRALPIKERALAMARAWGEDRSAAATLHDMSAIWTVKGDLSRARSLAEEAVAIRRRLGFPDGIAHALHALGEVELHAGNLERARELFAESIEQTADRLSPHAIQAPQAMLSVAEVDRRLGHFASAARVAAEAARRCLGWDNALITEDVFDTTSALLADVNDCHGAAVLVSAGDAVRQRSGLDLYAPDARQRTLERIHAALQGDDVDAAFRAGNSMSTDEALSFAIERCEALATAEG